MTIRISAKFVNHNNGMIYQISNYRILSYEEYLYMWNGFKQSRGKKRGFNDWFLCSGNEQAAHSNEHVEDLGNPVWKRMRSVTGKTMTTA